MANFKLVISDPKSRKAYNKEVEQAASGILGKKIGDKVPGAAIGLDGYSLQITGGSDKEGFPMRSDVDGSSRKKIILSQPPGYHPKSEGGRKRKSVRGNTVSQDIIQVNVKVAEHGKKSIEEAFGIKKGEKTPKEGEKEAKKVEKPAEAKEAKPEAKKDSAEKPKEDAKKAEEKMGVKELE